MMVHKAEESVLIVSLAVESSACWTDVRHSCVNNLASLTNLSYFVR